MKTFGRLARTYAQWAVLGLVMVCAGRSVAFAANTGITSVRTAAATATTSPLINHGGPVESRPQVYIVFWGWTSDPVGEKPYLINFLSSVGGSAWLQTVVQYGGGNSATLYGSSWSDASLIPASPTDAQIQSEAQTAMAHFGLSGSSNIQVIVATPTGHSTPGSGTSFCAYHGELSNSASYTVFPYQHDFTNCTVNVTGGQLDAVSIVAGHELAESITDPNLNAWYGPGGLSDEIGDKCAWIDLSTITTNGGTFAVQPLWSNAANGCVLSSSGNARTDTPVMTQGSNDATENGFTTIGADPIGSMNPAKTSNGYTYQTFKDVFRLSSGHYIQTNFVITGFTADPGQVWLTSAGCNGTTRTGASATYSYTAAGAEWVWTTGQMFGTDGNVNCTIVHN